MGTTVTMFLGPRSTVRCTQVIGEPAITITDDSGAIVQVFLGNGGPRGSRAELVRQCREMYDAALAALNMAVEPDPAGPEPGPDDPTDEPNDEPAADRITGSDTDPDRVTAAGITAYWRRAEAGRSPAVTEYMDTIADRIIGRGRDLGMVNAAGWPVRS